MPVMDGLQATREIRTGPGMGDNREVPLIAMTARALPGDRERFLTAGFDDYLSKPITASTLAAVLARWLPKDDEAREEGHSTASRSPVGGEEAPIFDESLLLERMLGDHAVTREIFERFLEDTPLRIEALQAHLETGDVAGADLEAHSIKSSAANVGGPGLVRVAREMESSGRSGDLESIRMRMPELQEQFRLLKEAIEAAGSTE